MENFPDSWLQAWQSVRQDGYKARQNCQRQPLHHSEKSIKGIQQRNVYMKITEQHESMVSLPGAAPITQVPSSITCNSSTRVRQAVKTSCFVATAKRGSLNLEHCRIVSRMGVGAAGGSWRENRNRGIASSTAKLRFQRCLGQAMDWKTRQGFDRGVPGDEIAREGLISSPHIPG